MVKLRLHFTATIALCVLVPGKGRAEENSAEWQAGAARIEITPTEPVWMAGYGSRDKPADGTLTPLWAKALALQDKSGRLGLVITLDLVGIDRLFSQAICQSLEQKHDLRREQVLICCSHTHTGPVVAGNLRPLHYLQLNPEEQAKIDRYLPVLKRKIDEVAGAALERLAPARLRWGCGQATFAVNRRENRPEGKVLAWRTSGKLKGPVNHDVPVLAVHGSAGKLKAILFGYACHATTLDSYQWSGDYPGFAQRELEQNNPDCVALFWAGCGADQNPLPRRTVQLAQHYGHRLADAVESVMLTSAMQELSGSLQVNYREIDLPLDKLPTRVELEQNAQASNKYEVARAKMLLQQIDDGKPLSGTYPYPISVWRLGARQEKSAEKPRTPDQTAPTVTWVALGGEVVVDYALRLKAELGQPNTWIAGYANDVMAYIPSRRVLREGGYEGGGAMVYYGLPANWGPGLENQIIQGVHALLSSR